MRIFGFAGWSGSGKTTLIEKVIPALTAQGLVVSLVKHAHHEFDVDQPGKDSYRHRAAGCTEVLVASSRRFALMRELRGAPEPTLRALVARLAPCDLVLVEGFKREPDVPKIEVHRTANGKDWLHPGDPSIVGLACDLEHPPQAGLPTFGLDDAAGVAAFVRARACAL